MSQKDASFHRLELEILKNKELMNKLSKGETFFEVSKGLLMLEERGFVDIQKTEKKIIKTNDLGNESLEGDLPQIKFLKAIISGPKKMSELGLEKDEFSFSLGSLKKEGLVEIKKEEELTFTASDKAQSYLDSFTNPLEEFKEGIEESNLSDEQKNIKKQYKNFLEINTKKEYHITLNDKGKNVDLKDQENVIEALTTDMLKTASWKNKSFRSYDVALDVPFTNIARRHPMLEANNILRDVFIEMGFQEMKGPMVEMAFWNMDVMWIPQDHPARDEQDTFYLEGHGKAPRDLMEKYKAMHEDGLKRTHTKKGDWSEEITQRKLLRTHSTSTTFRTLARLAKEAQEQGLDDIPNGKYFYVANVFRNEAVDATHLAEFYQAEGFIVGDNLSLADLMGFVKEYYAKLGVTKIRFKPTFNPYTEPSMEAHYYDEKMKKWYALINSGIFRQETLKPLGINKTIIAWGMGASRLAALLAKRDSMRDITGATCDFKWLKEREMMTRNIVR